LPSVGLEAENVTSNAITTCEELGFQEGAISGAGKVDPELYQLISLWPNLPISTRCEILALSVLAMRKSY
jgi:hypothetical protein